MFQFANSTYLLLLLILPILVIVFIGLNIKKRKDVEKLGNLRTMKSLMPQLSLKRSYLRFWFMLVIIGLCIIMIARPQSGSKVEVVEKEGIELVIAMDVSNSMLASDITPNRLAKAKQIMTHIINQRKEDKVAIIVFAGDAYVQMPMTSDSQSAKLFLENINPSMIPVQGTNVGAALEVSLRSFSGEDDIDKAVVLITDGENHEGQAMEMAAACVKKGVQVNVIGIGSTEGAPIPTSDNNGYKLDKDGRPVITKLNEEMCREIAEAGKGLYVHADNSNSASKNLMAELAKLQTKKIEGKIYSEYNDRFYVFAWIILLLLVIEICIFDKKNKIFKNIRIFK